MSTVKHRRIARSIVVAGAFGAALALPLDAAQAQDKTYEMKISTPTINDTPDTFARNFLAAVERDLGGRIKGEVYPASQLGSIPRQIEGTQFGSIQCEVVPPEFMVGIDRRFELMAAPGLVDLLAQGQKVAQDPGGTQADALAWCRQGAARRRPVHVRAFGRRHQKSDP